MKQHLTGLEKPRGLARYILPLVAMAGPVGAHAYSQTQLGTYYESRDGQVRDIAAQADAGDGLDLDKRAWLAEGRVRMAVSLSDRERMHDEDVRFSKVFTSYPWAAPTQYEEVLAVEVNEDRVDGRKFLYTLTESALYRHQISTPYSPVNPGNGKWLALVDPCDPPPPPGVVCPYGDHLQNWEVMRDIKIWNDPVKGDDGKVILLTAKRIVVIKDRKAKLEFQSSANDLFKEGPSGAFVGRGPSEVIGDINNLAVFALDDLRLADDGDGLKAIVSAEMGARSVGAGRGAMLLMICDMDSGGGFANPTFDAADPVAFPDRDVYLYWSPFDHSEFPPTPPVGATEQWNQLVSVYSHDTYEDAGVSKTWLYAACGSLAQLQRIDITNWFASGTMLGVPTGQEILIDSTYTEHVLNVVADPDHRNRVFTVRESASSIYNDSVVGSTVLRHSVNEPNFRKGGQRDLAFVTSMGGGVDAAIWTAGTGKVDHVCKVLDFSESEDWFAGPPAVALVDEYPALSSSDGAVYLDGEIYVPTFGGVIQYTFNPVNGKWESVPSSYATAEEGFPGSGLARDTEHIDAGVVSGTKRVFTAPACGEFMEFAVNAQNGLDANILVPPDVSRLPSNAGTPWAAWTNADWSSGNGPDPDTVYGNDVAYAKIGSEDYVFTILTNFAIVDPAVPGMKHSQHAILAYRWDDPSSQWVHEDSVANTLGPAYGVNTAARLAHTIAIHEGDPGKYFAFVGHKEGFFSVDISGLASFPYQFGTGAVRTDVFTNNVAALAASGNRMFVYADAPGAQIRIYAFDPSTGDVDTNVLTTYDPGNSPAQGGVLPFGPGRAFRARFHEDPNGTSGAGHLILACESGAIFKLAWPGPGGSGKAPEDTLGVAEVWRSDYFFEMQDCRVYDFGAQGTKILGVKNGESFAIINF